VRDALLNFIAHQKILRGKGTRAGSITIVYDYRDPTNELTSLKHRFAGIIEATLDVNLGEYHNLAIMAVNGDLRDISELANALQTQKKRETHRNRHSVIIKDRLTGARTVIRSKTVRFLTPFHNISPFDRSPF